jgi:hypothetical protein
VQTEASPSFAPSLAGHSEETADPDVWRVLAQTEQLKDFARAWIFLLARSTQGWRQGEILLGPPEQGPFEPIAGFPEKRDTDGVAFSVKVAPVLRATIERRRPAIEKSDESDDAASRVGFPLIFSGHLYGAVLIEVGSDNAADLRRIVRHLQWSAAGIEAFLSRDASRQNRFAADRAQYLIGTIDTLASAAHGTDAARAFANSLARRLDCDSVAVGRFRHKKSRLIAVSQNATLDRRNSLSRAIETAQDEAIDQQAPLTAPNTEASSFLAVAAHQRLSRTLNGAHVLTVPLHSQDQAIGAVTLRRVDHAFTEDQIDLVDALGAAAAPLLEEKWRVDRSLPVLAFDRTVEFSGKLFGPRHPLLKAITVAVLAVVAFLSLATDVYRVRAKAQIQGETRRIISAPFDGFIRAQYARAGDVVQAGAPLADLEDNDLELDRLRQISHKRQYQLELDKALAKRDLAEINIARAQMSQADAEIDLSSQMIARAKLRSPFPAVVVNGDLSQSVGKPVTRGDVLFELAPLDRYRMNAVAPESEIGFVKPGQHGELLLSALPDRTFPVEITSITSVAQAGEGVNGFEVIAPIEARDASLRPGMEGVVKIEVGRRNITWIWVHPLIDWLRIKIWSLVP